MSEVTDMARTWPSHAFAAIDGLRGTTFIHLDPTFNVTWTSGAFQRLFGFDPVGTPGLELVHPDDVEICASMLLHFQSPATRETLLETSNLTDGTNADLEVALAQSQIRLHTAEGRWIECAVSVQSFMGDPNVAGVLVRIDHLRDQTILQRAIETIGRAAPLVESLSLLSKYCINDSDITDAPPANSIVWWNSTGEHTVTTNMASEHISPLTDRSVYAPWMQSPHEIGIDIGHLPNQTTIRAAKACGYNSVLIAPVTDDEGEPLAIVLTWSSLPQGQKLRPNMNFPIGAQLVRLALLDERRRNDLLRVARTDTLTNINNRVGFNDALQRLTVLRRFPIGSLFVDIDDFKVINDTYGHPVGDAVLRSIGKRLQELAGTRHLVARLGGDEFVMVIANHPSPSHLESFAHQVHQALTAPVILDDCIIDVGVSIGVSTAADASQIETLIDRADQALYRVKRAGKGRVSLYGAASSVQLA
jgi:diguanylate cyclase (GGDEF)-like protein